MIVLDMLFGLREQRALQRRAGPASARAQAARTQSRKSVATWSLRERAVCSRPAGGADQFGQPRLDIHVDVFELALEDESAIGDFLLEWPPGLRRIASASLLGDNAFAASMRHGRREPARSCAGEALVEIDRGVDLLHDAGGAALEPSAPHFVGGHAMSLPRSLER